MTLPGKRRAFSLIELIVVVAAIAILASIALYAVRSVMNTARKATCMNNLQQISVGMQLYVEASGYFPPGNLPASLGQYVSNTSNIFVCPMDRQPDLGDSYSEFYVPRGDPNGSSVVIACPRHSGNAAVNNLYGGSSIRGGNMQKVLWQNHEAHVGDVVTGGALKFADNSTATLSPGLKVQVLATFNDPDGICYTILRVLPRQQGSVTVQVTPGGRSKFEVITPAVIAGVQGTRFLINLSATSMNYSATVSVSEGKVYLENIGRRGPRNLTTNATRQITVSTPRALIETATQAFWTGGTEVTGGISGAH